jgi:IS1 family transposase
MQGDKTSPPFYQALYHTDAWRPLMHEPSGKTYRPWQPQHYGQEAHSPEGQLPEGDLVFFLLDSATPGDAWVWIAFAPLWRLVVAIVIGKRGQASADLLLPRVAHVTDDYPPFFTSDQRPQYKHALLTTYGERYHPERQSTQGALPHSRRKPLPGLLYAQVVKKRVKERVVEVNTRAVFGSQERVEAYLATPPVSRTVNTSFVERDNLTQRQSNRYLTRRTHGFSKDLTWFEKQLWVSLAYYHLVLPHKRLQEPLPMPEPT